MPREATVHWNPPTTKNKTRCGLALTGRNGAPFKYRWRTDPNDATCNNCRRLAKKDGVLHA